MDEGARGMNKKKGKMSTVVCFVAEEATRDVFGPSRKTEHLINPLLHCKHTMAKPCSLCLVALLCAVSSQVGVFAGFTGSHQRKRPTAARRFDRQTSSSVVSSLPGDERDNHERQQQRFIAPLDLSPIYDDRKPRRPWSKVDNQEADHRADWGVSKEEEITDQEFPYTAVAVIDQAFQAIAGTLYQTKKMEPSIASNAISRSIFDYRPTRRERDSGRMGVEFDGAQHLFPGNHNMSPERATRRLSLMLAAKISMDSSWEEFENESEEDDINDIRTSPLKDTRRPVAVYFNTIKQALMASRELQSLKRAEHGEDCEEGLASSYDHVSIQCLGDKIPKALRRDRSERRRYGGLTQGYVNVTHGLILIVQPTDYNNEYRPPGPAVGSIGSFQQLAAQASIEEVATVAISPRFLSNKNHFGGWDQSGYQQSSTYGGVEPPKGPTPWIMRDFTPPVYCWVGNAVSLRISRGQEFDKNGGCYLSRVALMQTVMGKGHGKRWFQNVRNISKFASCLVFLTRTFLCLLRLAYVRCDRVLGRRK
jgi:hypothetical protein